MINVLRAEWIKLRTVRMNWVLAIIALAFPLIITLLTSFFSGDDDDFDARTLLEVLIGTGIVSTLLCGVIAAASITSEFGFGTIRPTFAAVPHRARVVLAKGIVGVLSGMLLLGIVVPIGVVAGQALAESQDAVINVRGVSTAVPALLGLVVLAGLMSLAGYGLGLLMRSSPMAIATLIVWPLIAEGLIAQLIAVISGWNPASVHGWMPFQAGLRVAILDLHDVRGPDRLVSGLYFGGVAMLLALIGAFFVNRRDA